MCVHGLIDSSDVYLVHTRENSIPMILADQGYDVYLVNTRGNKYSAEHTTLDPNKDWEYWENAILFDIAKYDLPAFIEFIKNKSNVDNVTYIGHSQGSQVMLLNLAGEN